MVDLPLLGPVPLSDTYSAEHFDCGVPALNEFLSKFALANDRANTAKTYVVVRGEQIVGYYSLAAASISFENASPRFKKGIAKHPVPLILLARLAVDVEEKGKRLGEALLKDVFKRFIEASRIVGSRGLVTEAKDDNAKSFYLRYGFEPWPPDGNYLYLLTKDILATLAV